MRNQIYFSIVTSSGSVQYGRDLANPYAPEPRCLFTGKTAEGPSTGYGFTEGVDLMGRVPAFYQFVDEQLTSLSTTPRFARFTEAPNRQILASIIENTNPAGNRENLLSFPPLDQFESRVGWDYFDHPAFTAREQELLQALRTRKTDWETTALEQCRATEQLCGEFGTGLSEAREVIQTAAQGLDSTAPNRLVFESYATILTALETARSRLTDTTRMDAADWTTLKGTPNNIDTLLATSQDTPQYAIVCAYIRTFQLLYTNDSVPVANFSSLASAVSACGHEPTQNIFRAAQRIAGQETDIKADRDYLSSDGQNAELARVLNLQTSLEALRAGMIKGAKQPAKAEDKEGEFAAAQTRDELENYRNNILVNHILPNIPALATEAGTNAESRVLLQLFFNRCDLPNERSSYMLRPAHDIARGCRTYLNNERVTEETLIRNPVASVLVRLAPETKEAGTKEAGTDGLVIIRQLRRYFGVGAVDGGTETTSLIDVEYQLNLARMQTPQLQQMYEDLQTGTSTAAVGARMRYAADRMVMIETALTETIGYQGLNRNMQIWCIYAAHFIDLDYVRDLVRTGILARANINIPEGGFPTRADFDRATAAFGKSLGTPGADGTPVETALLAAPMPGAPGILQNTDRYYRFYNRVETGKEAMIQAIIPYGGLMYRRYTDLVRQGTIQGVAGWSENTEEGRALAARELNMIFSTEQRNHPNVQLFLENLTDTSNPRLHNYSKALLRILRSHLQQRAETLVDLRQQGSALRDQMEGITGGLRQPLHRLWGLIRQGDVPAILATGFLLKNLLFGGKGGKEDRFRNMLILSGGLLCLGSTVQRIAPGLMHQLRLSKLGQKGTAATAAVEGKESLTPTDMIVTGEMADVPLDRMIRYYRQIMIDPNAPRAFSREAFMAFGGFRRFRESRNHYPDEEALRTRIFLVFDRQLQSIAERHFSDPSDQTAARGLTWVESHYQGQAAVAAGVDPQTVTFADLLMGEVTEEDIEAATGMTVPEALAAGTSYGWQQIMRAYQWLAPRVSSNVTDILAWAQARGLPATQDALSRAWNWSAATGKEGLDLGATAAQHAWEALRYIAINGYEAGTDGLQYIEALYVQGSRYTMEGIVVREITKEAFGRPEARTNGSSGTYPHIARQSWNTSMVELNQEFVNTYQSKTEKAEKDSADDVPANFTRYDVAGKEVFAIGSSSLGNFVPETSRPSRSNAAVAEQASYRAALEQLTAYMIADPGGSGEANLAIRTYFEVEANQTRFARAFGLDPGTVGVDVIIREYVQRMHQRVAVYQIGETNEYITYLWLPMPNNAYTESRLGNDSNLPGVALPTAAEMAGYEIFSGDSIVSVLAGMDAEWQEAGESWYLSWYREARELVSPNLSPSQNFRRRYGIRSEQDYNLFCTEAVTRLGLSGQSVAQIRRTIGRENAMNTVLDHNRTNTFDTSTYTWKSGKSPNDMIWAMGGSHSTLRWIIPELTASNHIQPPFSGRTGLDGLTDAGGRYRDLFVEYYEAQGREAIVTATTTTTLATFYQNYINFVARAAGFARGVERALAGVPVGTTRTAIENRIRSTQNNFMRQIAGLPETDSSQDTIADWNTFMTTQTSTATETESAFFTRVLVAFRTRSGHKANNSEALDLLLRLLADVYNLQQHGETARETTNREIADSLRNYIIALGGNTALDISAVRRREYDTIINDLILAAPNPRLAANRAMRFRIMLYPSGTGSPSAPTATAVRSALEEINSYAAENSYNTFVSNRNHFYGGLTGSNALVQSNYRTAMDRLIQSRISAIPQNASDAVQYRQYLYLTALETSHRLLNFSISSSWTSLDRWEPLDYSQRRGRDWVDVGQPELYIEQVEVDQLSDLMEQSVQMMTYEQWAAGN